MRSQSHRSPTLVIRILGHWWCPSPTLRQWSSQWFSQERGSQMNGKALLPREHDKPKLGFVLCSTYKLDTGLHRQVSPSGGRMSGVSGLLPSNTMISSSISWIDNLCWLHGSTTSQSTRCCLLNFFLAQWWHQWQGILDICHWECAIRHIECKETKMTRTLKHKPNQGYWWISNHICDCCKRSAFVEYKCGSLLHWTHLK